MALRLTHLTGGAVTYPPATGFGPRRLRDYELVWVVQGSVVHHIQGQPDTPLEDGAMVLCRPGTTDRFTWDPTHPTRHAYLHFDFDELPDAWPKARAWPDRWQLPTDDVVRPLFRYLLANAAGWGDTAAGRDVSPVVASAVETLLGALIMGPVAQASELAPALPGPVARSLGYVRQRLDTDMREAVTLDDLAGAAKVSPEHLCRLFREALDTSPVQAVSLLRLDRAMTQLVRSDLTVAQVADRTGFASPFHFSRRFKQVYGKSPSQARKAYLDQGFTPVNKITDRLRLHTRGK